MRCWKIEKESFEERIINFFWGGVIEGREGREKEERGIL